MKKLIRNGQTLARKAGFIAVGAAASSSAFAIETADIEAAFETGSVSVGTVVTGLISLAAIGVGIGLIMGLLRKS